MTGEGAGDRSLLERVRSSLVDVYRRVLEIGSDDAGPPAPSGERSDATGTLASGDDADLPAESRPADDAASGDGVAGNRSPETTAERETGRLPRPGTRGATGHGHVEVGDLPDALRPIGVVSAKDVGRGDPQVLEGSLVGDRLTPRSGIDPVTTDLRADAGIGYRRDRVRLSFLAGTGLPLGAHPGPGGVAPGVGRGLEDHVSGVVDDGRAGAGAVGSTGTGMADSTGPGPPRSGTRGPARTGPDPAGANDGGPETESPTHPDSSTGGGSREPETDRSPDDGGTPVADESADSADPSAGGGGPTSRESAEPTVATPGEFGSSSRGRRIDRRIADAAARTPREDPWPAGPRKAPGHPDRSPAARVGTKRDERRRRPDEQRPNLRFGTREGSRGRPAQGSTPGTPGRPGDDAWTDPLGRDATGDRSTGTGAGRTGTDESSSGGPDRATADPSRAPERADDARRESDQASDSQRPDDQADDSQRPGDRTGDPSRPIDRGDAPGSKDRVDDGPGSRGRSDVGSRSRGEIGPASRAANVGRRDPVGGSQSSGRAGRRHLRVGGRPWPLGPDDVARSGRESGTARPGGRRRRVPGSAGAGGPDRSRIRRSPASDRPSLRFETPEPADAGGTVGRPASTVRPGSRSKSRPSPDEGPTDDASRRGPRGTASRRRDHRVTGTTATTSRNRGRQRRSGSPNVAETPGTRAGPGASDPAATRTRVATDRRSTGGETDRGVATPGDGRPPDGPDADRQTGAVDDPAGERSRGVDPAPPRASRPDYGDRGGDSSAGDPPRLTTLVESRDYDRGSTSPDVGEDGRAGAAAPGVDGSSGSTGLDRSVAARTRWPETVTGEHDAAAVGETARERRDDPGEPVELSARASKPPEKHQEDKMPQSTLEPDRATRQPAGRPGSGSAGDDVPAPGEQGRATNDAVSGAGFGDERARAGSVDGPPGFPGSANRSPDRGEPTDGPGIGRDPPSMDLARPAPSVDRTRTDDDRSGGDHRTGTEASTGRETDGRDRTHRSAPVTELFAPGGPENPGFDAEMDRVVDELYRRIERRMRIERERRGL